MSFFTDARHFGSWVIGQIKRALDYAERTPFRGEKFTIYGALALGALTWLALFAVGLTSAVALFSDLAAALA